MLQLRQEVSFYLLHHLLHHFQVLFYHFVYVLDRFLEGLAEVLDEFYEVVAFDLGEGLFEDVELSLGEGVLAEEGVEDLLEVGRVFGEGVLVGQVLLDLSQQRRDHSPAFPANFLHNLPVFGWQFDGQLVDFDIVLELDAEVDRPLAVHIEGVEILNNFIKMLAVEVLFLPLLQIVVDFFFQLLEYGLNCCYFQFLVLVYKFVESQLVELDVVADEIIFVGDVS